jgi:hypothetical protein
VDALKKAGAKAKLQLYKGKTHTDVFVQVSYPDYPLYLDVLCYKEGINIIYYSLRPKLLVDSMNI